MAQSSAGVVGVPGAYSGHHLVERREYRNTGVFQRRFFRRITAVTAMHQRAGMAHGDALR